MRPRWSEINQAAERARWCAVAALRLLGGGDYVLHDAPRAVVDALASRHRRERGGATAGLLDAVYSAASVERELRSGHAQLMGTVRAQ